MVDVDDVNLQEGDILSQAVDDVPQLPGDGAVFLGVVHACVNRNSLNLATCPYDMFFRGGHQDPAGRICCYLGVPKTHEKMMGSFQTPQFSWVFENQPLQNGRKIGHARNFPMGFCSP